MKNITNLAIAGVALAVTAAGFAMSPQEVAALLAAQRQARGMVRIPAVTLNEPVSASLPTNIHSSVAAPDVARIPLVLKADGFAIGLLKWTALVATPADPVAGYEVSVVNNLPITPIHATKGTEFPFNVNMLTLVAYDYWRVRTVFVPGRRSAWNISRTFPENVTLAYNPND